VAGASEPFRDRKRAFWRIAVLPNRVIHPEYRRAASGKRMPPDQSARGRVTAADPQIRLGSPESRRFSYSTVGRAVWAGGRDARILRALMTPRHSPRTEPAPAWNRPPTTVMVESHPSVRTEPYTTLNTRQG